MRYMLLCYDDAKAWAEAGEVHRQDTAISIAAGIPELAWALSRSGR